MLDGGDLYTGPHWNELRENVREAAAAFYFDRPETAHIRMHLVRDEMLATSTTSNCPPMAVR